MNTERIYEKQVYNCNKCKYTTTHRQNYFKHINSKLNPCRKYNTL